MAGQNTSADERWKLSADQIPADLFQDLPEAVTRQVVRGMDQQNRERLQTVLAYEPDTAGGLMNTDTVTVRPDGMISVDLIGDAPPPCCVWRFRGTRCRRRRRLRCGSCWAAAWSAIRSSASSSI